MTEQNAGEDIEFLNLCAGLGGNRLLLQGVKVTAVELNEEIAEEYQRQFPQDTVIVGDAGEYLKKNYQRFGYVWGSPPCQKNSRMVLSGRNRTPDFPDLTVYEWAIFLKQYFKGNWCIENVIPYYKPLIEAQKIGRHLFWANYAINDRVVVPEFKNMMNRQNLTAKKQLQDWLGIHYEKTIYYGNNHCPTQVLRNCVHPLLGSMFLFANSTNQHSPTFLGIF